MTDTNVYEASYRHHFTITEVASFAIAGIVTAAACTVIVPPLSSTLFAWVAAPPMSLTIAVTTATVVTVLACLVRLSMKRKEKSAIHIKMDGHTLEVVCDGMVGSGTVDVSQVSSVAVTEIGFDECVVLYTPDGKVTFPVRVLKADARIKKVCLAAVTVRNKRAYTLLHNL